MIPINSIAGFMKSPALTSWFNLFTKTSTILIILPLVNNYFTEIDRFVWFTITTFWSIILLMDLGLNPTLTRYFSYLSGKGNLSNIIHNESAFGLADVNMLVKLISQIYNWIVLVVVLVILPLVFFSMYEKISGLERSREFLMLLCFSCFASVMYLKSNVHNGVVQGLGYLPKVQLVQGIVALLSCFLTVNAIIFSGSLLLAVIAFYIPFCGYFFVISKISRNLQARAFQDKDEIIFNEIKGKFKKRIIGDAWKSGIGILASQGFILVAALLINKFEPIYIATSFMLSLQLIRAASSYSQVPFYSLLPFYCKLYSQKKYKELSNVIKHKFLTSLLLYVFITLIVCLAVINDVGIFFFGSNFEEKIWFYFVIAYFFERIGALLVQVYTITGDVKWHIVNGGGSLISLSLVIIFYEYFDAYLLIFLFALSYILWVIPFTLYLIFKKSELSLKPV